MVDVVLGSFYGDEGKGKIKRRKGDLQDTHFKIQTLY